MLPDGKRFQELAEGLSKMLASDAKQARVYHDGERLQFCRCAHTQTLQMLTELAAIVATADIVD